jgi:internalin A
VFPISSFHREYLLRLPLPLAQLYSRAHNAKDARDRHDNTFYLFEALVKLTTAPAVAAYVGEVEGGAPCVAALDRLLLQIALPSLGQWLGLLRELARHFGARTDAASHPLGHLWTQLNTSRRDLPGVLALYRRIKNGPEGAPASDQSCSLLQLLNALVLYRNVIFGHGAVRLASFYEQETGPLLIPAADEVLADGTLDLLGPRGSRLVLITGLRALDERRVEVGIRELVGLQGERAASLQLSAAAAQGLAPNGVAVFWPGHPLPLRLDPLLLYREDELAEQVLFLDRGRYGRQVEYLSYTTGRTERDRSTAPALVALLSRAASRAVSEEQIEGQPEQSHAAAPCLESLVHHPLPPPAARGKKEVFISYAWGEDTALQGRQREEVVNRLCERLKAWDHQVVRDKETMKRGDRISAFMKRIMTGDRVIVVLSEKYLRSVFCMSELHGLFLNCGSDEDNFLGRVIPLTLADAHIDTPEDRAAHTDYWIERVEKLKQLRNRDRLASQDGLLLFKMNQWAQVVGDMLAHIANVLHRRGFDEIVADDFAGVRELL